MAWPYWVPAGMVVFVLGVVLIVRHANGQVTDAIRQAERLSPRGWQYWDDSTVGVRCYVHNGVAVACLRVRP